MANSDGDGDGEKARRADGLDPIGQALRATYDADNHDSLGGDLTGLMLALARVDDPAPPPQPQPLPLPLPLPIATSRSWRERLFGR